MGWGTIGSAEPSSITTRAISASAPMPPTLQTRRPHARRPLRSSAPVQHAHRWPLAQGQNRLALELVLLLAQHPGLTRPGLLT